MKTSFLLLIILLPLIVVGQHQETLCGSCVHKEFHWNNGFKCDENKLRAYYEYKMNNNITHVKLCETYSETLHFDNFLCKDLMPLEEFVSDTFKVYSVTTKDGFYLNDDNAFVPQKFYLISFGCKDASCPLSHGGCLIIYDIDKFKASILDSIAVDEFFTSISHLKHTDLYYCEIPEVLFKMHLQAYFDKDIWTLMAEDGSVKTLLGDTPLIDLVYKKFLIPRIHVDRYYFETDSYYNVPKNSSRLL